MRVFIGEETGVATLDRQQNLRNSTDFRSVYKTLLEDWLGRDFEDAVIAIREMQIKDGSIPDAAHHAAARELVAEITAG